MENADKSSVAPVLVKALSAASFYKENLRRKTYILDQLDNGTISFVNATDRPTGESVWIILWIEIVFNLNEEGINVHNGFDTS